RAAGEPVLELAVAASPAVHQRDVALVDRAAFELARQAGVRLLPLGVDQDARGVLVETLMHAEIRGTRAARPLGEKEPEPVNDVVRVRRIRRLARHPL